MIGLGSDRNICSSNEKAFKLETAGNVNHLCKLNGFRRFSYPKEAGLALGGPGFSPFVMLEVSF